MANIQEHLENNESASVSKRPVYNYFNNLFVYTDKLQERVEQKGMDMQDYLCELMNVYQSYHDFVLTQQYVVRGSILKCHFGTKPALLDTIWDHGVYMDDIPVMTCKDCRSENIHNFGSCMCPEKMYEHRLPMPAFSNSHGEVAEKALYNKFPHICVPLIDAISGWQQEEQSLKIVDDKKIEDALIDNATLVCRYGGVIQIIGEPLVKEVKPEDNKLVALSDEYIEWLKLAEGNTLYPYLCTSDSKEAKAAKTVTIGIGVTFNKEPSSWTNVKSILGWDDDDINTIITKLFKTKSEQDRIDWAKENYPITEEQSLALLLAEAEYKYIPNVNDAIDAYRAENPDNIIIYSQCQLEAIFDFAFNNGQNGVINYRNDSSYIIYYYLRDLQEDGVKAVVQYNTDTKPKRRINQMYLFFKEQYDYIDTYKDHMRELGFDEAYISTKDD